MENPGMDPKSHFYLTVSKDVCTLHAWGNCSIKWLLLITAYHKSLFL